MDGTSESDFRELLGKPSPVTVTSPGDLDATILSLMSAYHIPGLQACIIIGDTIVWAGEYGFMDPFRRSGYATRSKGIPRRKTLQQHHGALQSQVTGLSRKYGIR